MLDLHLKPLAGKRVLQLGCNIGLFLHYLTVAQEVIGTGIESSERGVSFAREECGLDVRLGNAFDLPDFEEQFDAVIAAFFFDTEYHNRFKYLLGYDYDPAQTAHALLSQAHRVLKPGGIFVISAGEFFPEDTLFERATIYCRHEQFLGTSFAEYILHKSPTEQPSQTP